MLTKCQQKKKFATMMICHCLLQYTTHILSFQSKNNELREARGVFFQWLSGHSQTGKCLVDLYRRRYPLRCWLVIREFLWKLYRAPYLYRELSEIALFKI